MRYNRTVEPTTEPVTLTEAKAHLRVTHADEDTYIGGLITAAAARVEEIAGYSIMTQTWQLKLDAWSYAIELPRGPVASVASVQYTDTEGVTQTVAASNYTVDLGSDITPAFVVKNEEYQWPDTLDAIDVITITYVTGKSTLVARDAAIKHAVLLLVANWFDSREGMDTPAAVYSLLEPYKQQWIAS